MVKVIVDHDKCNGIDCGECADVCPMEILIIDGDEIKIQCQDECSMCEVCLDICPNDAIKLENR